MKIPHGKLLFLIQNFGVFRFFGENFVTPFSTLAKIKGSLPSNSTTTVDCDREPEQTAKIFPIFWVQNRQKVFLNDYPSSGDLHPKRSP